MAFRLPNLGAVTDVRTRFGTGAAIQYALHRLINKVAFFECMNIIVLEREQVRPLDPARTARLASRFATLADLEALQRDPKLGIEADKLASFKVGDACLLSYVGDELAGYTWAHTLGRPELIPGLRISVPRRYVYNYAALTLPEFRGLGLQPYRHHQLLNSGLWHSKCGLLGYVLQTNFASREGQKKSGYRKIGSIWLLGSRRRFFAWFSPALRRFGVHRLPASDGHDQKRRSLLSKWLPG